MQAQVEAALAELEEKSPGGAVRHRADAEGGAWVLVEAVETGIAFKPSLSAIGFHVTHSYPEAIPYPHILDAGIVHVGEGETPNEFPTGNLPKALTRGSFTVLGEVREGIQVSRTSPGRDPFGDTALAKLLRVIHFLRSHR